MPRGYDDVIAIDADRLDREWVDHPSKVLKYGLLEADARHEHAKAKAQLELVESRLSRDIRSRSDEKPTEPAIKAAIIRHKDYRAALIQLNDRKHDLDVLSAVVSALEHRKKALEKAVDLHMMDYRSEPRARSERVRERIRNESNETAFADVRLRRRDG